ncbi:helix-turn-helix transcriptional regulator [Piscinibacter gummiphilus]|uniref:Transcriptional regulator n=1 Tax=Piscinibacter gummiphilus TaxID=946333 RepID=A0A1W6LGP9_9BURK|nr:helix-turn-helix transcriptional regulator [Piscinibacter gummiphilus]ARN23451.1 transcriptional regulator [Piscinibacter gummiphilus]GLS97474.1 hypothetical protein GCM10007918_47660 [Piscinibacter gummiphilus]
MTTPILTSVLDRQLLLQLGDRLKRLREAQGMSSVEMAQRVGMTRNTLRAIESGDPAPSFGNYLRVMSILGVSGDLALVAAATMQPAPPGSAAARSRHARPAVQVLISTDSSRHQAQDLQSLALHEHAISLVRTNPDLLNQAQETLRQWLMNSADSRSVGLWREWENILEHRQWRKALGRTRRAQELRQASPLVMVLPEKTRQAVLKDVRALKNGVVLGDVDHGGGT